MSNPSPSPSSELLVCHIRHKVTLFNLPVAPASHCALRWKFVCKSQQSLRNTSSHHFFQTTNSIFSTFARRCQRRRNVCLLLQPFPWAVFSWLATLLSPTRPWSSPRVIRESFRGTPTRRPMHSKKHAVFPPTSFPICSRTLHPTSMTCSCTPTSTLPSSPVRCAPLASPPAPTR